MSSEESAIRSNSDHWSEYQDFQKPINLESENVTIGKLYYYLPGVGYTPGVVKILSNELNNGIKVQYVSDNNTDVIETDKLDVKKLYNLIQKTGGKRTRRRRKSRKSKKARKARKSKKARKARKSKKARKSRR